MDILNMSQIKQICGGIALPERPEGMGCECWTTLFSFSFANTQGFISNEAADYMMAMNCTDAEMLLASIWIENH